MSISFEGSLDSDVISKYLINYYTINFNIHLIP